MPDPQAPSEYIVARKVLLDCLGLLSEQSDALVLVGAQAIYLQTPAFESGPPAYTTDGDLVIDPDLLSVNPDVAGLLEGAGFRPHSSPGTWFSMEGVAVDLMVPAGSLPPSGRRTAPLEGQGALTARRTAGLELALVDNHPMTITALDSADERTFIVKVAGPAALVIAKLAKLNERLGTDRHDRILAKDASDILRILRYMDASAIGAQLAAFRADSVAGAVIDSSLEFFRTQLNARSSPMITLASEYHEPFEAPAQIAASFRTLGLRVLRASGLGEPDGSGSARSRTPRGYRDHPL